MANDLPLINGSDFAQVAVDNAYLLTRMARPEQGMFDVLMAELAMQKIVFTALSESGDKKQYKKFNNFQDARSKFAKRAAKLSEVADQLEVPTITALAKDDPAWYEEAAVPQQQLQQQQQPPPLQSSALGLLNTPLPPALVFRNPTEHKRRPKGPQLLQPPVAMQGPQLLQPPVAMQVPQLFQPPILQQQQQQALSQQPQQSTSGKFEVDRYAAQLRQLLENREMDYREVHPPEDTSPIGDAQLDEISDILRDLQDLEGMEGSEYEGVRDMRLQQLAALRDTY
jgi:hypothetical protein